MPNNLEFLPRFGGCQAFWARFSAGVFWSGESEPLYRNRKRPGFRHGLPRRLNKVIPKELESTALKAIAKEAQSRYTKAPEVSDDPGAVFPAIERLPIRPRVATVPVIARP